MKKIILAFLLSTLLFALAACGGTSNSSGTTSNSTSLSLEAQLLVGTFKLENTTLAVSSDQASQLLPLWETLQSLAKSGTAATEEIAAVLDQIKSTMSTQQINAIIAMKLTQQDLTSFVTEMGVSSNNSNASSISASGSAQGLAAGSGSDPGAGNPGGGGNPPADMAGGGASAIASGQQPGQAQITSSQADSSQSTGTSSQISSALISALVDLLQKKAG